MFIKKKRLFTKEETTNNSLREKVLEMTTPLHNQAQAQEIA